MIHSAAFFEIKNMPDLPRVVAESDVGSKARVQIWRKNKLITIDVILGMLPEKTYGTSSNENSTKEVLEEKGMPVITWRPLENEQVPKEARGLIIPGGFPEQHASQLSNSKISLNSIKAFSKKRPLKAFKTLYKGQMNQPGCDTCGRGRRPDTT